MYVAVCPELQIFWKEVITFISCLIDCNMKMDSKLCLLHIFPKDFKGTTKERKLISFCLLQAKHVIALNCKATERRKINQWIKQMSSNLALEKLTYITRGKLADFKDVWLPFLCLMKDCDM